MEVRDIRKLGKVLRLEVMKMISRSGRGFTGSALSSLDIIATLYFGEINGEQVLKYDKNKPGWEGRDFFVMSNWYSVAALYASLAYAGFFSVDQLNYFGEEGTLLPQYPYQKVPGVEATVTDLGVGLSVASGIALALRLDNKSNSVYVLASGAELQCGQFWESVLGASHYRLDNLCLFIDYNTLQFSGEMGGIISIEPMTSKFESFGWKVFRVLNGHDPDEILNILAKAWKVQRKPTVVICDTISAKGLKFAEGKVWYYGSALSSEELEVAFRQLT